MAMVSQGRLEEGERSLEQAERTLRAEVEPAAGMRLRYARGLLEIVSGRPEAALAAFRAAERLAGVLVTEHALAPRLRSHVLQALVRLGETQRVEQALAEMGEPERDSAEMRNAIAVLRLAQDDPEAAAVALAPVVDGAASLLNAHLWEVQHAQVPVFRAGWQREVNRQRQDRPATGCRPTYLRLLLLRPRRRQSPGNSLPSLMRNVVSLKSRIQRGRSSASRGLCQAVPNHPSPGIRP